MENNDGTRPKTAIANIGATYNDQWNPICRRTFNFVKYCKKTLIRLISCDFISIIRRKQVFPLRAH